MQIEAVISAIIVVDTAPAAAIIPDGLTSFSAFACAGSAPQKTDVHRIAPTVLSCHGYLQRLVEEILFACHDVGDIPKGVCVKGRSIHMNVNAAAKYNYEAKP